MKNETGVLYVLFPQVRAEILRLLFGNPSRERYVRQIARDSDLSLRTVQQELAKLEESGLIVSRKHPFFRFYSANRYHPLFLTLHNLVIRGVGKRAFTKKRKRPRQKRIPSRDHSYRNPFIRGPLDR